MIAAVASIVAGVVLMVAPALLGYAGSPASDVQRTIGPIVTALGIIAIWSILRGARLAVIAPAVALAASPLMAEHSVPALAVAETIAVLLVAFVTRTGGGATVATGGGWRSLLRDDGSC